MNITSVVMTTAAQTILGQGNVQDLKLGHAVLATMDNSALDIAAVRARTTVTGVVAQGHAFMTNEDGVVQMNITIGATSTPIVDAMTIGVYNDAANVTASSLMFVLTLDKLSIVTPSTGLSFWVKIPVASNLKNHVIESNLNEQLNK